jgi:eukaryotic-like serine/threonine-protein kinase
MSEYCERVFVLFTGAIRLSSELRRDYLERECAGNDVLMREVEALLLLHERKDTFVDKIPPEVSAHLDKELIQLGANWGKKIKNYRLLRKIGEGGCGIVFLAEQMEPIRRQVALKIIKPGMDSKSVIARFEAERQALALLDHPHIAKVFDAGTTGDGTPFYAMDFVDGIKITEFCDQNRLSIRERLNLFAQVCEAIQHAHQKGIIHRDIKPSNVLVTRNEAGVSSPVVIDFGLAKATSNQPLTDKTVFTAVEMFIGTPAYMSPEQASLSGIDIDTRSDIYSLGVLLYELLAGRTPFDSHRFQTVGFDEIRRVIREEEPIRPSIQLTRTPPESLVRLASSRNSESSALIRIIRGDLEWIVMKALEKERHRRYETANSLALDVKRCLSNEPISARPPGKLYKFGKLFLRNKLLFIAVFLIVGTCLVSLILVSAALAREKKAHLLVLAMMQKNIESENEEAADALNELGLAFAREQKWAEAEQSHCKALALRQKIYGNEAPEVAESMKNLASAEIQLGKNEEAEALIRGALKILQRHSGDESLPVADLHRDLCILLGDEGRWAESAEEAKKALAIRTKYLGPEDPSVAATLNDLAWSEGGGGGLAEAESLERQALKIRQKVLGQNNPDIAESLYLVGDCLRQRGRLTEAEDYLNQALAEDHKLTGHANPFLFETLYSLGMTLQSEGRLQDSENMFVQALNPGLKQGEPNPPQLLSARKSLLQVLIAEKKFDAAVDQLNLILTSKYINEASDFDLLNLRLDLMARRGRWAQALPDAYLLIQIQPDEHFNYHKLAALLVMNKNYVEYRKLCQTILSKYSETEDAYVAERMAQDCLLRPDSGVSLVKLNEMADFAVRPEQDGISLPFSEVCKALACYRLRRFAEATSWADKATHSDLIHARAKAYAILAMVEANQGHLDKAKEMVEKGNALAPPLAKNENADLPGESWVGWVFARASLDEATTLIGSQSNPPILGNGAK